MTTTTTNNTEAKKDANDDSRKSSFCAKKLIQKKAIMRFKKQVCVAMTFLSICSCAGRFEMKKGHFVSEDGQQKYPTAFRIKFNYEEKNTSANPISGCRFYFSGDGLYNIPVIGFKTSERSYEYKVKQDYVFVEGDSGDIYLSAIECLNYRVLYNKIRLKRVGKKIFLNHPKYNNKIAYGGDVEINWDAKEFNFTDLFIFGHMGYDDDGSFSINMKEDYVSYLKFMKEGYEIDSGQSIKAFSKINFTDHK